MADIRGYLLPYNYIRGISSGYKLPPGNCLCRHADISRIKVTTINLST